MVQNYLPGTTVTKAWYILHCVVFDGQLLVATPVRQNNIPECHFGRQSCENIYLLSFSLLLFQEPMKMIKNTTPWIVKEGIVGLR